MKLLLLLLAVSGAALGHGGRGGRRGRGPPAWLFGDDGAVCEDVAGAKVQLSGCLADKADEMEEKMAEKEAEKEERQAAFAQCFTENGCEDPTELKEELRACKRDAVMEAFGDDMVACVEGQGIDIPEVFLDKMFKGGKGKRHWGGRGRGRRHGSKDKMARKEAKLDALTDKLCSADEDREAVKACVMELKEERREAREESREEGGKGRGRRGGRRGGKGGKHGLMSCYADLPAGCGKAILGDLCQCAGPLRENPEELFGQIREDVKQCKAEALELDEEEEEEEMGEGEARRKGRKMGKILKFVCARAGGPPRRG